MIKNTLSLILITTLVLVCLLSSCATYTIPPEELYSMIHEASTKPVTVNLYPYVDHERYSSNGVKEIVCYDKHGKKVVFPNSPKVEMRITDKKNRKHIFYFDTVLLKDSVFTGMNSRILATHKSISYSNIKKVEVQKGAKAFHYADK